MVQRSDQEPSVTQLLHEWRAGDPNAPERLLWLIYADLRALAANNLGSANPPGTFQPTDLVHDAYIRLLGSADRGWNNRRHFIAAAVAAMRSAIVDRARARKSLKRGGGTPAVPYPAETPAAQLPAEEILAVHEALDRLEAVDARAASILSLRCFGGLTLPDIALVLDVSERMVRRDWEFARRWLRVELSAGHNPTGRLADEPA